MSIPKMKMKTNTNESFEYLEHVNLDDFLQIDENRKPNKFGMYRMNCLIIGKTGSGKTTTLLKALLSDVIDDFGLLLFVIPIESLDSGFYKTISSEGFKKKINKHIAFCIIGEEPLPTIKEITEISRKLKKPIALVLDDFINAFKKDDWLVFKRYVTQLSRVPYGASLFALTQNLLQFPTTYRKNFNCFVLFCNSLTLLQFKEIMRSYYDYGDFTKDELELLYSSFKTGSHTPLWLINSSDKNKSMMFGSEWVIFGASESDSESDFD